MRARQLAGAVDAMLDLAEDVDAERDHIRGPDDAPVTLVEYGDYECPYCGQAEVVDARAAGAFGDDLRYVWRHFPLNDVHPHAQMAAEAAEAAAAQGSFWEMHDLLLDHQDELSPTDLDRYAEDSASTSSASGTTLRTARHAARVTDDVAERGRERRRRHADLLRQRPPPQRRLRHRHARARPCARPPRWRPSRPEPAQASAAASARPAVRPENRQPPRKVPSSAR